MRGGKGIFAALLALAALLLVAVPVSSARELRIQTSLNPGGRTGSMSVASPPGSIGWEACTAQLTECRPWARGRRAETLSAPAGTIFRVRDSEGESGISPEWRGPLTELTPPRVVGSIEANGYVSPVPGLWAGGWGEEYPRMQLSACETEAGDGCVSITSPHFTRVGCSFSASFLLNPIFSGWYLRVADKQDGGEHAEAGYGVFSPSGATWGFDEVWGRSRTTSVAVVGQIGPAANPSAGECGPPPAPAATISADGVARVECAGGCGVVLAGARKGRQQLVSRRIPAQSALTPFPALEMQLSTKAEANLGIGVIQLTVEVDGKPLARRAIDTSQD
jgi:hypothetical protein